MMPSSSLSFSLQRRQTDESCQETIPSTSSLLNSPSSLHPPSTPPTPVCGVSGEEQPSPKQIEEDEKDLCPSAIQDEPAGSEESEEEEEDEEETKVPPELSDSIPISILEVIDGPLQYDALLQFTSSSSSSSASASASASSPSVDRRDLDYQAKVVLTQLLNSSLTKTDSASRMWVANQLMDAELRLRARRKRRLSAFDGVAGRKCSVKEAMGMGVDVRHASVSTL